MRRSIIKSLFCLALALWALPLYANDTAFSPFRIVVLGDSLSAGYGLEPGQELPMQLQKALRRAGHDVVVTNAGVSGDTTAGGLARLDWALQDDPQLVIVALGGNDALRGLDPRQTYDNLERIISRLKADDRQVILAGMKAPRNLGPDYVAEFDRLYPALARKHNIPLYPFLLEGVAARPELNQSDGIHPNKAGVARIVEGLLPLVTELLPTD